MLLAVALPMLPEQPQSEPYGRHRYQFFDGFGGLGAAATTNAMVPDMAFLRGIVSADAGTVVKWQCANDRDTLD